MSRDQNRTFRTDRRALLGAVAGLSLTGAGLVACSGSEAPVDDQGRIRIRFATDSRANAEHGGFYQALASGAYERRGLNVLVVQGAAGAGLNERLSSGAVELAMGDSAAALGLVSEGAPVKAVAAFFQKDPHALIVRPDRALTGIADLAGRPFLLSQAATISLWPWLKTTYGFSDDQLRPGGADASAFLADPRAVLGGDLTIDPDAIARQADFEPRIFLPADDDYPSYGCTVLSPDGFARDNARALRAFIAASAEGWRDYMRGDPTAADALIRRANPQMTQAALNQARTRLSENGVVDAGDAALYGLGAMTSQRWQAMFDALSLAGVYPVDLRWRTAFTDEFLPGRG